MSLYKGAFIENSLPVERGVRRVRVSATLDPFYYSNGAGGVAVYASSEMVVNLRVMQGSRIVASERVSLSRIITAVVGLGFTEGVRRNRPFTLQCEFTRPVSDDAATYTLIAEIEGWAATGGFPSFAVANMEAHLQRFQVYLHRDL